eukprot:PITA_17240
MSKGGSVADYLNDFNIVTSQLSSLGVNFDEKVRALLFLCSLPECWNGLVMDISNFVFGSSNLKFNDVVGAILSKEMQWKSSGETLGNALNVESRGRKMERGKSSRYHSKSRKGRSKYRSGILCWKCRKKGHIKKDYRSWKRKEGDAQQENNHEENVTVEVLQDSLILSFKNIIAGASFHATLDKKYFHDYVEGDFGQVHLGDYKPYKIVGMDNGGEYCRKEFDRYCSENGIHGEKTIPRKPQENGVSKRMNKKIMERARCMRLHAGLPLQFWVDAIDTTVYLKNRGPSSSLDASVPQEAWTGKKEKKQEKENKECIVLYEITEKVKVPKNNNKQQSQQQQPPQQHLAPQTPKGDVRRSTRISIPPKRYSLSLYYLLLTDSGEPECYEEEMQVDRRKKLELAMEEEMDALMHNQTWDLVRLPAGKTKLQNKWVYRLKEEDGGKQRCKARLVVKEFSQKKGIYFDEIFSPIIEMTSTRTILSLVGIEYLHLEPLDVQTTFLHGDLEEEVYIQQPQGYEVKEKEKLVCKLKKSLYGLKQAPR